MSSPATRMTWDFGFKIKRVNNNLLKATMLLEAVSQVFMTTAKCFIYKFASTCLRVNY